MTDFPLFPEQASTFAGPIDLLYWVLVGLSLLFGGVLPFIILYLMVKYHRSNQKVSRLNQVHSNLTLELTWTAIPLLLVMGVFFWGAFLYIQMRTPPETSLEVYVIGKQWMWHAQHPNGKRENNELHVPIGRPVKLIMTSQDVIHSFYIPAFRVKQDVLPGRYTTMWFEATKEGEYHLFCAEYCGTEHAKMGGRVVAMSLRDYEQWLVTPGEVILPDGAAAGGPVTVPGPALGDPMALVGAQLFSNLGCASCHRDDGAGAGPSLVNLYGNEERLADGSTLVADEAYLAESILNPQARIVAGYQPIMPAYQGQLNEDQVNQLVAYIKSISDAGADGGSSTGDSAGASTDSGAAPTTAPAAPPATTAPAATQPTPAAAPTTAPAAPSGGAGGFDTALAARGETLYANQGCASCHGAGGANGVVGPSLVGLYNTERPLADGSTVLADEAYLTESIANSTAKVAEGYNPIMPPYSGVLSEEQIRELVEYLKSLGQ
jgi:cytochrome c oxidase subunit 2